MYLPTLDTLDIIRMLLICEAGEHPDRCSVRRNTRARGINSPRTLEREYRYVHIGGNRLLILRFDDSLLARKATRAVLTVHRNGNAGSLITSAGSARAHDPFFAHANRGLLILHRLRPTCAAYAVMRGDRQRAGGGRSRESGRDRERIIDGRWIRHLVLPLSVIRRSARIMPASLYPRRSVAAGYRARTCAPVLTSKLEISHIRAYPDAVPTEEYPLVRKPCAAEILKINLFSRLNSRARGA